MPDDLFQELVEWYNDQNQAELPLDQLNSLEVSLRSLGLVAKLEAIVDASVQSSWFQDSVETYSSTGVINIEDQHKVRSETIAAYALISPPPIDLESRAREWLARRNKMEKVGIPVPKWHLIWKATIFASYPPFSFDEFISSNELDQEEIDDFGRDLNGIIGGMAQLGVKPLNLMNNIRTNGLNLFYCGMGFDIGTPSTVVDQQQNQFLLEASILDQLPQSIIDSYRRYSNRN